MFFRNQWNDANQVEVFLIYSFAVILGFRIVSNVEHKLQAHILHNLAAGFSAFHFVEDCDCGETQAMLATWSPS